MKVVIYEKFGNPDVLEIREIDNPVPNENEVLIKVYASTVTAVDSIFRIGKQFFARMAAGITKPKNKILGTEFSGEIIDIGSNVKNFKIGDKVFGPSGPNFGTYSEFICLPEDSPIEIIPSEISVDEAAAIPSGALTALPFLRDTGKIKPGNKILIIGASGSVGTYAVQMAKYFGAEVTGVCSTSNVELVKSLGADKVIDYKKEDYSKSKETYDVIFDTVGKGSYAECKHLLKPNGIFMTTFISATILYQMLISTRLSSKKAIISFTGMRSDADKSKDLKLIKKLIEEKKLKAVIDKKYSVEQIQEAHAHVDSGHKKGNVLVTFI